MNFKGYRSIKEGFSYAQWNGNRNPSKRFSRFQNNNTCIFFDSITFLVDYYYDWVEIADFHPIMFNFAFRSVDCLFCAVFWLCNQRNKCLIKLSPIPSIWDQIGYRWNGQCLWHSLPMQNDVTSIGQIGYVPMFVYLFAICKYGQSNQ